MILKLKRCLIKLNISFAIIALAIFLYSCSGNSNDKKTNESTQASDTKTTAAKPSNVCSLITEEEAKAVIGGAVKKGGESESMCQYLEAGDKISQSGSVTIQLTSAAAGDYDNYILDAVKNFNAKAKTVAGVGEKAFFISGELIVFSKQHIITVIVGKDVSETEVIASEKRVAQKAIERL